MRTILITGTSHGIGHATALHFLEKGWRVFGTSRKDDCQISNTNFTSLKLTLENTTTIKETVNYLKDEKIVLDALFNNAGAVIENGHKYVEENTLIKAVKVNVLGPIILTQELIKAGIIGPWSKIVFNSSRMGLFNGDQYTEVSFPEYKMTKAMLNKYVRLLSQERKDLHISAIHPGSVNTRLTPMSTTREPSEAASDIYWLINNTELEPGHFWDIQQRKIKDW